MIEEEQQYVGFSYGEAWKSGSVKQAQLEYARSNYSRMKEAVKSDAVSQIQVLQAESSVAEGVAAGNNAEAALITARTNLSYCYVRAPFDGTISKACLLYTSRCV